MREINIPKIDLNEELKSCKSMVLKPLYNVEKLM